MRCARVLTCNTLQRALHSFPDLKGVVAGDLGERLLKVAVLVGKDAGGDGTLAVLVPLVLQKKNGGV